MSERQRFERDYRPTLDKDGYLKAVSKLMIEGWSMTSRTCPMPICEHCVLLCKKATVRRQV
jgi:hypothetical protein